MPTSGRRFFDVLPGDRERGEPAAQRRAAYKKNAQEDSDGRGGVTSELRHFALALVVVVAVRPGYTAAFVRVEDVR